MAKCKKTNFIEKAQLVHGDVYDYSKVEFKNVHTPVIIVCPVHGDFKQRPVKHTSQKCGCPKCGEESRNSQITHDKTRFIEKARFVHSDTYDYSKVSYVNNNTPVTIVCPVHGDFKQRPVKHTSQKCGCPMCNLTFDTEGFVEKAQIVHGERYDYSNVEFVSSQENVKIICKFHGVFYQTPNNHLQGYGCYECAKEHFYGVYNHTTLSRNQQISTHPSILYLLKFTINNEVFYKIGITTNSVETRFSRFRNRYEIIKSVPLPLYEAYYLEQDIIEKIKQYSYRPEIMEGNGATECFKLTSKQLQDILAYF